MFAQSPYLFAFLRLLLALPLCSALPRLDQQCRPLELCCSLEILREDIYVRTFSCLLAKACSGFPWPSQVPDPCDIMCVVRARWRSVGMIKLQACSQACLPHNPPCASTTSLLFSWHLCMHSPRPLHGVHRHMLDILSPDRCTCKYWCGHPFWAGEHWYAYPAIHVFLGNYMGTCSLVGIFDLPLHRSMLCIEMCSVSKYALYPSCAYSVYCSGSSQTAEHVQNMESLLFAFT